MILIAALLVSAKGLLYAQKLEQPNYVTRMKMSKTERTFNANEGLIGIRDFVTLKSGSLILELSGVDDYENFRNLDSLLELFRKDIAFYKDTLDANLTANNRIDYVVNSEYDFKKIRFRKYCQENPIFLSNHGAISRMKFEQDTVRLILQKSKPGLGRGKNAPCSIAYTIQATFILGNYYDIDKLINDHVLRGIVDTLEKVTLTKRIQHNISKPWYIQAHPVSINYNPYFAGSSALTKSGWLLRNEYDVLLKPAHKPRFVGVIGDIGAGLVRNTIVPLCEVGLQYNNYFAGSPTGSHSIFRLSAIPYFFFDRNIAGDNIINDNWFVDASIGSISPNDFPTGWPGRETTLGFGYLVSGKGNYFKNTTFKIFTDLLYASHITIVPEFIFTNNMKQIYPGITVKVF